MKTILNSIHDSPSVAYLAVFVPAITVVFIHLVRTGVVRHFKNIGHVVR